MFQKLTKIFIFSYNYFLFDGGGEGVRNLLQISIKHIHMNITVYQVFVSILSFDKDSRNHTLPI